MPLINPIFGLPTSTVERLNEADKKNGQRERSRGKNPASQKKEDVGTYEVNATDQSSLEVLELSQPIDSETVVELLEELVKTEDLPETQAATVSSVYEHVKKPTGPIKIVREI